MSGDGDDRAGEAPSPRPPPAGGGGEGGPADLPLPLREGVGGRGLRALCRIDDIPDGGSKGFGPPPGGFTGLFAVRQGDAVHVYVNSCPHIGTPLDWMPDRFLSADGSHIICATHGAEFRISDGECVYGPCMGDRLEAVMIQINDGTVFVPEDAGL
jgi:nitrite reductase/ring-hydroxylating ferredoxin subunit